jgi:hypothetical protein
MTRVIYDSNVLKVVSNENHCRVVETPQEKHGEA